MRCLVSLSLFDNFSLLLEIVRLLYRSDTLSFSIPRSCIYSNFVLFGEREVACGGLFWTWRKMFDRSLFDTEGVWLHSRLFVGQASQLIISVFLIGFFFAVSLLSSVHLLILRHWYLLTWVLFFAPHFSLLPVHQGTPILAERSQKARDELIAEFGNAGLPQ